MYADSDKITQVILNLLSNAVKYTLPGGKIRVLVGTQNGQVLVEISDTGIGIAKEDLPHIFERFYRGSKVAKTIGSGLGLAIAKGIIVAHHGSLAVTSEVGRGTTVTIFLPLNKS